MTQTKLNKKQKEKKIFLIAQLEMDFIKLSVLTHLDEKLFAKFMMKRIEEYKRCGLI